MVVREFLRGVLVDEALVHEPVDGAALGSDVPEDVPRRDQFGKVLIELVPEPTKASRPLKRPGQASSSRTVAEALSEVGHVENRVNLDLRAPADMPPEGRTDSLEAECTPGRARRTPPTAVEADSINGVCTVMQDPEGNEFCLD